MTRTVPAGIATQLSARRARLSRCVMLDLRDGTSLGITDHDRDLSVPIGGSPAELFRADVGALPSALSLTLGLDASSFEVRGPIGETVTRQAVLGGRFNRARGRLIDVDWSSPANYMRLMAGKVTAARVEGGAFVFEIRSHADAYNQTIGRVLTPYCSNDFGVFDPPRSYCQATRQEWPGFVAGVTDDLRFLVSWDSPAPTADDIVNGEVEFTSGALEGCLPVEVFNLVAGVTVETYQPLVEAPQIGDALVVREGCDKLRPTCKLKGQILNFRGFPDVRGTDDYLQMPIPGASS